MKISILSSLLLLSIGLRLHSLDAVTLDWDEDLYRAYAEDLLRGKMLYRDLWDHKPPGIFYLFAAVRWLHPSVLFFRMFSIAWSVAAGLVLAAIGCRLWGRAAGWVAFLAWSLVTSAPWGTQANAELSCTLFSLLSVYFFVRLLEPGASPDAALPQSSRGAASLLAIGFFAALAFQCKPVAAADFAAVVAGLALLPGVRCSRIFALVGAGFLVPNLVVFAYFLRHGLVGEWWYASFWYNFLYVVDPIGEVLSYGPRNLAEIVRDNAFFLATALLGLGLLWRQDRTRARFFAVWICLTFFSVSLGLKFLKHYFVQWMAPLCLIFAFCFRRQAEGFCRRAQPALWAFVAGWVLYVALLQGPEMAMKIRGWRENGLHYDGVSYRTAAFVKRRFPGRSLYVWRSPHLGIYFLSGQRPATRFLFWRHLTRRPLVPWIDRQWRSDLQASPPDLIVTSGVGVGQAGGVSFMDSLIRRRYRPLRRLQNLTIYQRVETAPEQRRGAHRSCCGSAGGAG
ncbi:MAG: hypothetical protein HYX74_03630 [Acidobacteria bacterium]|nr:hypothetical protein [Acidobacteriota bacterium]